MQSHRYDRFQGLLPSDLQVRNTTWLAVAKSAVRTDTGLENLDRTWAIEHSEKDADLIRILKAISPLGVHIFQAYF